MNGVACGAITLPGDYGGRRGKLNPDWRSDRLTQYGDLYHLWVDKSGTFVNEHKLSNVTLSSLDLLRQDYMSLRLHIRKDARNVEGINLFGEKFGDYEQNQGSDTGPPSPTHSKNKSILHSPIQTWS